MREYCVRIGGRVHSMQLDDDDVKRYDVVETPTEKQAPKPANKQAPKPANKQAPKPANK